MFLWRRSFYSSLPSTNLTPAKRIKLAMKEFNRLWHEKYRKFIFEVVAPKSYEPINPPAFCSGSGRYGFVLLKYEDHAHASKLVYAYEIRCYDKKRGEVLFNTTTRRSILISLLVENHPETGKDYVYLADGFLPINLTDVEMGEDCLAGRGYVQSLSPCKRWGFGFLDGSGGVIVNLLFDFKDPMNPKDYQFYSYPTEIEEFVGWHPVEGQDPVMELKVSMEEECEPDCDIQHMHITKEMIGYTSIDGKFVLYPSEARTHSLFIRPSSVIEGRY